MSLRSRERFWDIQVPKIDSIFDNSLVPRTHWSPGVPPQHRKLVVATHRLEEMLEGLEAPAGALVVMDRGLATEANLAWLKAQGYRYLVVSRERTRYFDPERAICIRNAAGESLQLEKVLSEDGQEVRLYCHSERRARKEEAINERFAKRFEQALDQIAAGLSKPRTTKRLDKLWERCLFQRS